MTETIEIKLELSGSSKWKDIDKLLFRINETCNDSGYNMKNFCRSVTHKFDSKPPGLITSEDIEL